MEAVKIETTECPRCHNKAYYEEAGICLACEEYDEWNQ
jgi:hypothetical protein